MASAMDPQSRLAPAAAFAGVARVGLIVGALLFCLVYLWVVANRITYPFELEWMEGATVDHVRRVLDGRPLYVAPSLEFIPFIYPPLYYYAAAALAVPLGVGLLPLRLISAAATGVTAVILFSFARRATGRADAGVLSASLFLATYSANGYWFDVARVDSLFVCLAIAGAWALRFGSPERGSIAAGVLFALAALTKQSALLMAAGLALACVMDKTPRRYRFALAFALTFAAIAGLLDAWSGGWFRYYVFSLPAEHPWTPSQWARFWTVDIVGVLPVAVVLSTYAIGGAWRDRDRRGWLLAGLAAGFVGAAWVARLHEGGFVNVLMPAHAAIALLFGLGYGRADTSLSARPIARTALYAACMAQFVTLAYNPSRQVPQEADAEAGRRFVAELASIDGDVYVPFHGHLPSLAGKRSYAHDMAIRDVFKGSDQVLSDALQADIDAAIRSGRFAAIVLDSPSVFRAVDVAYVGTGSIFDEEDVFWPVTGKRTRPASLYRPR